MNNNRLKIRFTVISATIIASFMISYCQSAQASITGQLRQAEQKVLLERQSIENLYASQYEQLRISAEKEARRLSEAQRMLWTKFIDMHYQTNSLYTYFLTKPGGFISSKREKSNKSIQRQRDAMTESYFLTAATDLLMDEDAYGLLKTIVESKEQSRLIRVEAQEILRIMERLQWEIRQIENKNKALLADLQRWGKVEKEQLLRQTPKAKLAAKKAIHGVVMAINYGDGNVFAMIGEDIIRPGGSIGNVKVVDIQRYKIKFKKDRKTWTQKIGESANPVWMN